MPWKLDEPIPSPFGPLDSVHAVKSVMEMRYDKPKLTLILGHGVTTDAGVVLGHHDHSGPAPDMVEFPVVEAPLVFEDDGSDPEMRTLFDDYQALMDRFLAKGLAMVQSNPNGHRMVYKAWGYRRQLTAMTHEPHEPKRHRARVQVVRKDGAK